MYLKSLARGANNFTAENAIGTYFSVPKIASPEARTKFSKKTYYSAIQRDGPTGSTRGGAEQRRDNAESVLSRRRCVPKIALRESQKPKSTTAVQSHGTKNPDS